MTSRDAVNFVQRLVRPAKAGHAGTLDPLAVGVLVVCVGSASRLIEYVQRMRKQYVGTFLLGQSSPTEDIEGELTAHANPTVPTLEQITSAKSRLVGRILQRPPAFSALKVGGKRAYDMARAGQPLELQPRPIEVHSLDVVRYEYPELVLEIECGSGTYVRSLGRDLAESLGTSAVMSALTRTTIGSWQVEEAIDPRQLTAENWKSHLEPMQLAVSALPTRVLTEAEISQVRRGLFIPDSPKTSGDEVAAVDTSGNLAAILVARGNGQWGPSKNFSS